MYHCSCSLPELNREIQYSKFFISPKNHNAPIFEISNSETECRHEEPSVYHQSSVKKNTNPREAPHFYHWTETDLRASRASHNLLFSHYSWVLVVARAPSCHFCRFGFFFHSFDSPLDSGSADCYVHSRDKLLRANYKMPRL